LVGGACVVKFEWDLNFLGGDSGGDFTTCEEVKVATDQVDRAAVLIVLGVTIFVGAMFGRLSLGGLVHFEIVNGCEREASFGEEKPDSEGSARVDFSNFFAERLLVEPTLEKKGDSCFVSRVGVVRVEDLAGFGKLLPGGGPLLTLSMGFLDSDNVIVVKKFLESLFLSFPAGFGHAFSG
jgi:hypothetical protein